MMQKIQKELERRIMKSVGKALVSGKWQLQYVVTDPQEVPRLNIDQLNIDWEKLGISPPAKTKVLLVKPPSSGAADLFLRWLLSPAEYEGLLGDLEEGYWKRLSSKEEQYADRWYKQQLFGTTFSFLWDACRRWAGPGRKKKRL
jgi:hypothetical protein